MTTVATFQTASPPCRPCQHRPSARDIVRTCTRVAYASRQPKAYGLVGGHGLMVFFHCSTQAHRDQLIFLNPSTAQADSTFIFTRRCISAPLCLGVRVRPKSYQQLRRPAPPPPPPHRPTTRRSAARPSLFRRPPITPADRALGVPVQAWCQGEELEAALHGAVWQRQAAVSASSMFCVLASPETT